MDRIRLALADDQKLFVESLARTIKSRSRDIVVVGIAYNGQEILEIVGKELPDLVLMDVRMPVLDGVEAAKQILTKHPGVKVMMLTTFDDDEYVLEALQAGAAGYLLKNISPEEVITSVRAVIRGGVQISSSVAKKLVNQMYAALESQVKDQAAQRNLPDWYYRLNQKEREILILISKGCAVKEISESVHLADQTVRNYMSGIYKKLGMKDRAGISKMVMEAHLE